MSRKSLEERAKRIVEFYLRTGKDKKKVVDHFGEEGICKRTVNKVIKKHEERGDVSFIKPTGRKGTMCTPEMFDKVATLFRANPTLPSGEAAKQLGIARTTIFRILAKMRENDIETFKEIETRCPTCHQKCNPKALIKKKKNNNNKTSTSDMDKKPKKTKVVATDDNGGVRDHSESV